MIIIRRAAKRCRALILVIVGSAAVFLGIQIAIAQSSDDGGAFVPLQTSINALMVALVDHSAHEVWESSYAETITGREWQQLEQHAIQLVASGTLMSLPGTGVADRGWVTSPAWQDWSQRLTDGALAALAAVQDADQAALAESGDLLVETCEGCHAVFKPDSPTEGIMHIPHFD